MDGEMIYINSTVLAHHGIKGQEWGKRLYQNPDGSLTPLGRLRYRKGGDKKSMSSGNDEKPKVKSVSEMTDNELRDRINRLNMEKQYRQLVAEMTPKKKSTLRDFAVETCKKVGYGLRDVGVDAIVAAAKKRTAGNGDDFDMKAFTETLKSDINGMDPDTIKQVATWYENAQKITKGREKLGNTS